MRTSLSRPARRPVSLETETKVFLVVAVSLALCPSLSKGQSTLAAGVTFHYGSSNHSAWGAGASADVGLLLRGDTRLTVRGYWLGAETSAVGAFLGARWKRNRTFFAEVGFAAIGSVVETNPRQWRPGIGAGLGLAFDLSSAVEARFLTSSLLDNEQTTYLFGASLWVHRPRN